jgi:hypothetical protein
MNREASLERCLSKLIECPELTMPLSEGTQHLLRESRMVLSFEQHATVEEIMNLISYLGERIENLRLVQEQMIELMTNLLQKERQRTLFD